MKTEKEIKKMINHLRKERNGYWKHADIQEKKKTKLGRITRDYLRDCANVNEHKIRILRWILK